MTSVMIGSNTNCGRVCYCCYSCRSLFWTTTGTNCVGGGVIAWHMTGVRFSYCFGWTAIIGNATAITEKLWNNRQTLCISTQGATLHTVCLLCHESLVQQMQEVGRWYQMRLLQGKKLWRMNHITYPFAIYYLYFSPEFNGLFNFFYKSANFSLQCLVNWKENYKFASDSRHIGEIN